MLAKLIEPGTEKLVSPDGHCIGWGNIPCPGNCIFGGLPC
jgi:hypothetical protein